MTAWDDTLYDAVALTECAASADREGFAAILKAARPWRLVEALARLLDDLTGALGEDLSWDWDGMPATVARDPSLTGLSAKMAAGDPAAWCEIIASLVNAVAAKYDVDVRQWAAMRP